MQREFAFGLILISIIALTGCRGEDEAIEQYVAGDERSTFVDAEVLALPAAAEHFLATDRPWRAARALRRYVDEVDSLSPRDRLLAARAEAGWGAWSEAHRLISEPAVLDTSEHGLGFYILGRAADERGDALAAVEFYRSFLNLSPPGSDLEVERSAARLRLGLALLRIGRTAESEQELSTVAQQSPGTARWQRLLRIDALAREGDVEGTNAAVMGLDSGYIGLRAWRARIEAAWRSGDLESARYLANRARNWASTNTTRAEMAVRAGRAAVAMGDIQEGRTAFLSAIDLGPAGPWARAAADELGEDDLSPEEHLARARVLREQGLHDESIAGYEAWIAHGRGTTAEHEQVQFEYANALFYSGRYEDVLEAVRPIHHLTSSRMLRARSAGRAGDFDEAVRVYLDLKREFRGSANGALALLLAADIRQDEGDLEDASRLFELLIREYPGTSQMGLAMMRLAGIAYLQNEYDRAATIWDDYRRRYPNGPNALQSTYWSGRARLALGDSTGAMQMFKQVRREDRDSYYALLASRRLDEPFWPIPLSPDLPDDPAAASQVNDWMFAVDILLEAGFVDEASAEVDRLVGSVGSNRQLRYSLAEALADRGFSRNAIRIGLSLQASSAPSLRLLRILYPFPFRTLIIEEARERGIDPFIVAALIRQESMFEVRITSHVGARGLMQIMPSTGAHLAEVVGIHPWHADMLYHPEINVHLGTRYLAQHWNRYEGALPPTFSAYNAGSHQVERWKDFDEYMDDELFTERIPFRETRDYVKILTRNYALYSGIYGSRDAVSAVKVQ